MVGHLSELIPLCPNGCICDSEEIRDARRDSIREWDWGQRYEHQMVCNIIDHTSSFTLLMILRTFLTPLILIRHWLTMTHTQPWGSTPLLIESSHWIKSSFHFYPNFPMMSHCVSFYYSFSFWFIIWFIMLFWKGTFWNFLWLIDEQSLTDLWNVA